MLWSTRALSTLEIEAEIMKHRDPEEYEYCWFEVRIDIGMYVRVGVYVRALRREMR